MLKIVLVCCLAATAYGRIARQPLAPFHGRVIGGGPADEGEYPSQLSLQYFDSHSCGASVISENYALTASHCVEGRSAADLSVRSGSVDVNGGERHQVTKIVMHEDYNALDSWNNDIAVLEVSPPFSLGSFVQAIALPNQGDAPTVGAIATVIGWGRTSNGGPLSDVLKEVEIEIRDQDLCEGVYNSIGYDIYPGQICADVPEGNLGSCNGDSGGPLLVDGVVVGLVSWASGCATPGYPTVYNRVAEYRDWITQQTGV